MAVTPEFLNDVAEALDELGYSIENEQDVIDDVADLNDDVTLPGIRQTGDTMTGYTSMKLAVLVSYLAGRYQAEVKDVWDILEPQVEKAISDAAGADNLDASLVGMTVTITNRQGVSNSVNIGFEIYRTYTSVAAMNADAANVPEGKFVMIGTTDPTSAENARLYARAGAAAEQPFTFLSDLDQASSAAWADWLENMKPQIEAAISTAAADHTQAVSDHTRAESDHTTASTDHTTASNDHTQAGTDHTRAENDHTTASTDHTTAETDHTQAVSDKDRAATDHLTAVSDHTQAGQDHTRAETDHSTAGDDHTQAGQDHTRAESDHSTAGDDHTQAGQDHTASVAATNAANTQANRAKGYNDHPWEIGNDGYIYVWDETTQAMVKTNKMIIDFNDLTEAQKQAMIDEFYHTLVFATVAESEAAADELT